MAATGFGVSLGNSSGVAWRRSDVAGTVEGMIRQTVGAAWSPWPPDPLSPGSLAGSAPAVAGDVSGPAVVAWVEGGGPGGNCIQVRWAGAGWGLLAPICTHAPPGGVYAPSVAAAGPTAAGPVVGYYDLDGTGAGTWNLVAWDGTAWHELVSPERGSFGTSPAPQQFGSDATQVWKWTPVYLFAPPGATGGLPRDGRPPFLVSTIQGSPNVLLGQHGGAYRLTGAGTPAAAWNYVSPSPNAANVDGSVAISIAHVVLDPDGMSVAWTDADGFIHVRTLTP
jgi:hypothetical protein